MKKIAALFISIMLLMCTGCSGSAFTSENAKKLVQGNLDSLYCGIYSDEYLKDVSSTREECEADRNVGIEYETDFFKTYFDIDELSEADTKNIMHLYDVLYQNAKFEIGEVERSLKEFTITVTVYPIDFFEVLMDSKFKADLTALADKYKDAAEGSSEYAKYSEEWTRYIVDACLSLLETYEVRYTDPVELDIIVSIDEEHDAWMIESDSLSEFDGYVIAY